MRLSRRTRLVGVALIAAASLTLAGCGGGEGESTDAVISVNGSEPQNPLVPTMTNETGGGHIIDQLFAGLVSYNKDGSIQNEVAESIESEDNVLWTIKIKEGWKFTDGTEVTAASFVDAWNQGALITNNHLNSYFFYPIKGFADVQAEKPTAETMSGLKVVDDYTFTVELAQPENEFPLRLGYSAYFPLPEVAFEDLAAYGEQPIGNGPYKLAEGGWEHNVSATLEVNEDYDGVRKARNGGLKFVFYTDLDAAYSDVQAGNLDVLDSVPDSALTTFQTDDTVQAFAQAGSVFQSFTFPSSDARFAGEAGALRRQAISKAINREEVTDKIFNGTRTPAKDFSSPTMPGWKGDIAGSDVLTFDPEGAKKLWAEAEAIEPWTGKFEIAYNGDGGHQAWVDAVVNQIKNNLGIEAEGKAYATFDELRTDVTERTIKTTFRTGWQPDYPSIFNYLQPLYQTGAGSNDGDFSNADFDAALKKAAGATTDEDRYAALVEAQEVLFKTLPAIPLWNSSVTAAAAVGVEGVSFNWQNVLEYYLVTK